MVGTLGVVSKSDAIKTERETESGECRERQRRDCSAVLDDILQSLPIGIYLVDAELRIIEANAIAARTTAEANPMMMPNSRLRRCGSVTEFLWSGACTIVRA